MANEILVRRAILAHQQRDGLDHLAVSLARAGVAACSAGTFSSFCKLRRSGGGGLSGNSEGHAVNATSATERSPREATASPCGEVNWRGLVAAPGWWRH